MLLDACRSIIYTTACAVDKNADLKTVRRMVSESKKFVTEACQKVAHNAMQVMGGIGYTNIRLNELSEIFDWQPSGQAAMKSCR